jgi:multidrug efflux system membrane fusion protein
MKQNFLLALRMPLAAILAFALVKCSDNKAAGIPPAEDPIAIRLEPVTKGSYSRTLQYSGLIASNSEARLSFKVGGIISRIYVKEGDHVSKGQLLATLDLTETDAQVQQASQNVEKLNRDEARLKNLYRDTVASLEQLQNVRTQLSQAEEALHIAQFNRQYAQIRATEDGAILQKNMNEGELAASGATVLSFNGTQQNDWVVRFGVSDKDWALLKKGDPATVSLEAYPDRAFTGQITKVAEGADAASGTYTIEVTVNPGKYRLAPGLFCTLQLQPSFRQTLTMIPASALTEGDGHTGYVYTLNSDQRTVKKNPVRIAYLQKDQIAVSIGLENVQQVITDGSGYLTEKSIVKVTSKP